MSYLLYTVAYKLLYLPFHMEDATQKTGKKVYTLEDIQFNEANKTMAIIACIPIVGLILLFTEKNDKFVRYMGAQFTVGAAVSIVLSVLMVIPLLGLLIGIVNWLYGMALFVMMIVAMVKASKGERFDIPVISGLALKLMAAI